MIIIMRTGATRHQLNHVLKQIDTMGLKAKVSQGVERTVIGVVGDEAQIRLKPLEAFDGVDRVIPVQKPYKMVSRETQSHDSVIRLRRGVTIGGKKLVMMAGPCTVETQSRLLQLAKAVKKSGATLLRGGAYKPRTSPYDFQGLGEVGLKYMCRAAKETGMLVVTEILDAKDLPLFKKYVDVIQVGARNMQNFELLKELGKARKPVLLKRGMASTVHEFLMAAEYVYTHGNHELILCERGIRTFENSTRYTLDISAIPVLKSLSHLPVIVDPSHAAGKRTYVPALARAAIAAGADGLIVEVHDNPEKALCDGPQALLPEMFEDLVKEMRQIARVLGREL